MGLNNWFGMNGHKSDTKKTDEAVSRVVEARETVTSAADRLMRALDVTDSRMELTIGRLAKAKRVHRP